MRRYSEKALKVAVAGAATAAPIGAGVQFASQGSAVAAATGCAPPSRYQVTYFQACIATGPNSTGLYVDSLHGWGMVQATCYSGVCLFANPGKYHVSINAPGGNVLVNGPTIDVQSNASPTIVSGPTWTANKNVPAGNYCSDLWYQDGPSHWSLATAACIDVHS
jgi:hypothetical protein